ncbi:MAG: xanthine dehydrogenase family protein molybdopterin-binding subunit [Thermaerobacter sp.]|nr:xanthine dehydrogenase family protein molybdopterin-binding subunit [Thermaerobacter sp.]
MTYIGQRLPRKEDDRLVRGRGNYVDDIMLPGGMLHLAMVRSAYAHAQVLCRDFQQARAYPGVVAVLGPEEVSGIMRRERQVMADPRAVPALPTPLAQERVLHVGEAVAAVLAESRYIAEDAAERVRVQYREIQPVVSPQQALAAPAIHPELPDNRAGRVHYRVGQGRQALTQADLVVRARLRLGRVVALPMEPRGVLAAYDSATKRLTVYAGTQGVHSYRDGLAAALAIEPHRIRVVSPDTGGGFGVKNRVYPEDVLAAYCAMRWGRPVKWMGDRREEFISTNQERDQWHEAALGVTRDGRIVAVVDDFIQDQGAYLPSGILVADTTAISIPGPYKIPHFEAVGDTIYTNKVSVGPYRGAGRPQGTFVMERLLDRAADALGMDRVEIRRRNLVRPEDMPYRNGLVARGRAMTQESGDYIACLDAVVRDLRSMRVDAPAGWLTGLGIANYLEMSAGAGYEGAVMRLLDNGQVEVNLGVSFQGQGHETTFSQIAADRLQIPLEQVAVREGDTDAIARGIGTFGSRAVMMAGNAIGLAAAAFRRQAMAEAAAMLEAAVEDVEWQAGTMAVAGVPARAVSLGDLAAHLGRQNRMLRVEEYYEASGAAFGMGTHGVRVAIDPETLLVRIIGYQIRHDAGTVVNPLLADGQTIGATVQGLGTALFEELLFDGDSGQPINASLLDYLLPSADVMPDIAVSEQPHPDPNNPEGFKGLAEGGIMPPMAALCAAIEEALRPHRIVLDTIPVTPSDLFRALETDQDRITTGGEV